ncbi:MAG: hypothetical protein OXG39_03940 [Chloroflexi bacterium]|nr:hypothetical protein [Chloroflexota bacterium]
MTSVLKFLLRLCLVLSATVVLLEIAFQLAFLHLPGELIQRMPQYRERAGFRLVTEHGARESPAGQSVEIRVDQYAGDLFRLTCLSTDHAQFFQPYTVSFKRDQHGFRNQEPWHDDLDLLVLGDSFTAAEAIQHPFWSGLSDATLSLSFPGSGTIEQSLFLDAYGLPRNPDTVVLAYFAGNDLSDNRVFLEMRRQGKSIADRVHQNRSPFEYLVTLHIALYLRDAIHKANISDCHYPQVAHTRTPTPVAFFDSMLPILALDADNLRASDMFQATRSSIVDMSQDLGARGIRFVMMYIPQKAELYWPYLNAESKAAIASYVGENLSPLAGEIVDKNISVQRDLWLAVALEEQIEFLDLTPALRSAIENGNSPYFFADTHWNQLGHDLARLELQKILN